MKRLTFFLIVSETNYVQPRFSAVTPSNHLPVICKSVIPEKDKTIKLWKVSERDKRPEGYNLKDEEGRLKDMTTITSLQVPALTEHNTLSGSMESVFQSAWLLFTVIFLGCLSVFFCFLLRFPPFLAPKVPVLKPTDLMVEVRPRRVFSNGHTYHVNSISVNSDGETYLSADDLRINMWHLDITDRSFNILLALISLTKNLESSQISLMLRFQMNL